MTSTASVHEIEVAQEIIDWKEAGSWRGALATVETFFAQAEGWIIAVAIGLSALLPTAALLFRKVGLTGSGWFDLAPRFLTLAIGFIGASLATRAGGHIAIDLASRLLSPARAAKVQWYARIVAAVTSALLCVAAFDFLASEYGAGSTILETLPGWMTVLPLVLGFAGMALRFSLLATAQRLWSAPVIVGALLFLAYAPAGLVKWVAIAGLGAGVVAGTPIYVVVAGVALFYFWSDGTPSAVVVAETYRLQQSSALVTLPLFTFMGALLARSGTPKRLVELGGAWLGWGTGGLAVAVVLVSAFFTTFTGASGVTILALGLLLHGLLTKKGYSEDLSVGLVTASGSIGLLFAPALPLIVYGVAAQVDIDLMFKAGLLPGLVLIVLVSGLAVFIARKDKLERQPFNWTEARRATRVAIWELLLPLVILGAFLSGAAQVVEASALGLVYCLITIIGFKGELRSPTALLSIAKESGALIGAVLVILGSSLALTYCLTDAQIPQALVAWARSSLTSKIGFLIALNILLLVVGCLLDIFSAIIIFVPLIAPVAAAFGVHPVHLGIIFLANLEIGYLTPPVGMNLFLSSFRFKKELPTIWRTTAPFLGALVAALLVITFVPSLSLWPVDDATSVQGSGQLLEEEDGSLSGPGTDSMIPDATGLLDGIEDDELGDDELGDEIDRPKAAPPGTSQVAPIAPMPDLLEGIEDDEDEVITE